LEQPFYIAGGNLHPDAPSYIERRADRQLLDGLLAGEFCYVLDTRQVGKSSLMGRAMARLQEQGVHVASLDLAGIGQSLSVDQWYYGLLVDLGGHLGLREPLREFWKQNKDLGPMQRWLEAIRQIVLPALMPSFKPEADSPPSSPPPGSKPLLVLFVDEIDVVLNLPFPTDEFFAGIRECYTRRARDPIMRGLTFCLVGSATPDNLIQDVRTTPFNIGRAIELSDFTTAEAAPLAKGLSSGGRNGSKLLSRVLYWTNGHPYLTQRLCQAVAEEEKVRTRSGVDDVCEALFFAQGRRDKETNLSFVASRILKSEQDQASLLDTYALIRKRHLVRDDPANPLCAVLRLSGIVRVVTGYLWVRNRIYHRVFDRAWALANMPGAELRRQQAAYRRGLVRATALSLYVLATVIGGFVAVAAFRTASQAKKIKQLLYDADMNVAQQALVEQHNVKQALYLLKEHDNDPARGFAWGYLWKACHQAVFTCQISRNGAYGAVISPDGKLLITADADGAIRWWSAINGQPLRSIQMHRGPIYALAISPDGADLATIGEDQTVCICDLSTGKRLQVLPISTRGRTVAFSPNGKWLAAGNDDSVITLWNTATGERLRSLNARSGFINSLAFSPDGTWIGFASNDGSTQLWDPASGRIIRFLNDQENGALCLAFSPNGRWLATGYGNGIVRLRDTSSWNSLALDMQTDQVNTLAFSQDSRRLAIGLQHRAVRICEIPTGKCLQTLNGHTSPLQSVTFSPDGNRLATASMDGTAKVWNVTPGLDSIPLQDYQKSGVVNLHFSPDGARLAATGEDSTTVFIWNAANGALMRRFRAAWHPVVSLAFTSDGKALAIGDNRDHLGLYDVSTGRLLRMLRAPVAGFRTIAFAPDGRSLAGMSTDYELYRWDVDSSKSKSLQHYPSDAVLAFSSDGAYLVVGPSYAPAEILTQTGNRLPLHPATPRIVTASISPDGRTIVTGNGDGTAQLWDAETQQQILTLPASNDPILAACFANSTTLKTVDQMGRIHTWQAATDAEIADDEASTGFLAP